MKIVIFTSNAIRHKFLANTLAEHADEALIVSECKTNDSIIESSTESNLIREHFYKRYLTEARVFKGNDYFKFETLPIKYKEVNLDYIYQVVKRFRPEAMFVFGSSIIKEPLLSLLPSGRFINLHLGLSPYYLGSGTNFWPFVNKELEYVGSTILHIDARIDTGDIIAHVRPVFEKGDNVHTVGCKVIKESALALVKVMDKLQKGENLTRVKQWKVKNAKYYRRKDFNEKILLRYYHNLKDGLVEKYVANPKFPPRLINL